MEIWSQKPTHIEQSARHLSAILAEQNRDQVHSVQIWISFLSVPFSFFSHKNSMRSLKKPIDIIDITKVSLENMWFAEINYQIVEEAVFLFFLKRKSRQLPKNFNWPSNVLPSKRGPWNIRVFETLQSAPGFGDLIRYFKCYLCENKVHNQ